MISQMELETQDISTLKEKANALYKQGNYTDSINLYSKAISLEPTNPTFYSNRASAHLMRMDYNSSLSDCLSALKLESSLYKIYSRAAKCYLGLGQVSEAIEILKRGMQLASEMQNASQMTLVLQKDYQTALDIYQLLEKVYESCESGLLEPGTCLAQVESAMILTQPNLNPSPFIPNTSRLKSRDLSMFCSKWRVLRGQCLLALQQYEEALSAASCVLKSDMQHIDAILLRCQVLYLQERHPADKVMGLLSQTLSLDPENKKLIQLYREYKKLESIKKMGNEAFGRGEWESACEKYSEFLLVGQGVPKAKVLSNRANAHSKMNNYEACIQDCNDAFDLLTSVCLPFVLKDSIDSMEYKNSQQSSLFLKLCLRRADCLMKLEKYEEAIKDYKLASLIKETDREIKQALQAAEKALKLSLRKDYYKILGISKSASEDEIKKAYRKKALLFHPDKQAGLSESERLEAEGKFKEIGEAYTVLSDSRKKHLFDSGMDVNGASASDSHDHFGGGGAGVPMDDILQMFFQQQQQGRRSGFGHGHGHGFGGGFGGQDGFYFSG